VPDNTDHTDDNPVALERFQTCRWRVVAEEGDAPPYCGHRDVLPMAGTTGFHASAWCTDCTFFKAKRVPKKREEPPQQPDDWRFRY
jgi:hypothetical protein